ncbi:MAG: hypothetical protein KDD55_04230 [Bdellovibrionales bacterium]|nr:hypothetical protein [Bdellovibrionales bacterium]
MSYSHQSLWTNKASVYIGDVGIALLEVLVSLTILSVLSFALLHAALWQLKQVDTITAMHQERGQEHERSWYQPSTGSWLLAFEGNSPPLYSLEAPNE